MNNKLSALWLVIVILNLLACDGRHNTSIKDIHGRQIDIKNQWIVINYWTDWCKPCIKELPELNALNHLPNIQVIGINFDQPDKETLVRQINNLSITFPITHEPLHTIYQYALPEAIPMTVMISPHEKSQFIFYGPQTKSSLVAHIEKHE